MKIKLAEAIVALYHGEKKSQKARDNFIKTFQKKELPASIPEVKVKIGTLLSDALLSVKIVSSKSDFTRLILAGAIEIADGVKIIDAKAPALSGKTYRIGKHRFIKIIVEN